MIAATNKNLQDAIAEGEFREDLFYRLNAVRLKIPPLRERVEDIPLLASYFHPSLSTRGEWYRLQLSGSALRAISSYDWQGNVRELENAISRAVYLARGNEIALDDLPEDFQSVAELSM